MVRSLHLSHVETALTGLLEYLLPKWYETDRVPIIRQHLYDQKQEDQSPYLRCNRNHQRGNDRHHVHDRRYYPVLFHHIFEVAGRRRKETTASDRDDLPDRVEDRVGGNFELGEDEDERDQDGKHHSDDGTDKPADDASLV